MLLKNNKMKVENELLKQKYKNKKMGIFAIGMGVGAFFAVAGNKLINVETMDKAKYQIFKAKDKLTKTFNNTIDSLEEAKDNIELNIDEITEDDDKE